MLEKRGKPTFLFAALVLFILSILFGALGYPRLDKACLILFGLCVIFQLLFSLPWILDKNCEYLDEYKKSNKK